jgi:hypothetical protein
MVDGLGRNSCGNGEGLVGGAAGFGECSGLAAGVHSCGGGWVVDWMGRGMEVDVEHAVYCAR